MEPLKHLPDILHRFSERPRQSQAYNYLKDGHWFHLSTEQVINEIYGITLSLHQLGIRKGDRIGIYAKPSPYWSIADFAITLAGGVTVPFFSNLSDRHFLYEAKQSQPKWIFIGDEEDWQHVKPHRHLFEGTVGIEKGAFEETDFSLFDLVEKGTKIYQDKPYQIDILRHAIHPDDIATIIYSSGSTGSPKGVELTHRNLVSIIHEDDFKLRSSDKYLSILPLAHIFAKQVHLIMTAWGVPIYFLNDLTQINHATSRFAITRMITVPRVLEKAYSKMWDKVINGNILKRILGTWAFHLAHRDDDWVKRMLHPIADRLVYSKIRNAFGPHFHSILSGGAALNPHLHRFYLSVGIPIVQGWGMTEGSCMTVNRLEHNKIGTVGKPVDGIEIKISTEGEVLARGPTIMKGYYKNPAATSRAIDPEGWLHTGDYGHLDEDGHLVIEGRINESFKTSRGEYVIPVVIEQRLTENSLIDLAMVIGEGRAYPTALLFPDFATLANLKKKQGLTTLSDEEFLQSADITQEIDNVINVINQTLDHWQKIRAYRFIMNPPTIEGRELTPTLKLRRKVVCEKYADLIEEIYLQKQHSQV
jgi:long-chain acyl-CoA synthetase